VRQSLSILNAFLAEYLVVAGGGGGGGVDEAPMVLLAVLVGLVEGLQEVLGLVERVTHHFAHPLKAIMVPLVPNLVLSMAAVAGVVLVRLVQSV
jgi:hypothetical protein